MPRILTIIPARLASTRLPGKPLVDIAGKPMIVRTFERCASVFAPQDILVATDDAAVMELCEAQGIPAMMTSDTHPTGTDRVAEVARRIAADIYLNVQGDEPLFDSTDLASLRYAALAEPDIILNGYCPIGTAEEQASRSVPKVVFDRQGRLLYMSRAPIPGNKSGGFDFAHRQVCAYAFPPAALARFAEAGGKTPLEAAEDIEILRFLELGMRVKMIPMSDLSIPVDHPEDVTRVEQALRARGIS